MKTLLIDIEASPNLAHVWSLWNIQSVSLDQLRESAQVICFSAKWLGEDGAEFWSDFHHGHAMMVKRAHLLLSQADVVMHYNGKRYDIPHLNREFLQAGLPPPAPFQQIDLFTVCQKKFRFPSNKLDYVTRALGLDGKQQHEGHQLWVKCMAGDEDAWETMRAYNIQDVMLLEKLYEKLQPWVSQHPSHAIFASDGFMCSACGSKHLVKQGFYHTAVAKFQRYQCASCGKWMRDTFRAEGVSIREAPI